MTTIKIPEILLPKDVDMTAWAVNACDQFTSDEKYWQGVREVIGGKKSTYNLIYPEIYLKDNPDKRIKDINDNMRTYLNGGVFEEVDGMVLVRRTTASGVRTGIVLAVDLEDYSFEKGAKTPIRSTEATILERIPPRVKIRQNALIELPHIMLLYDDKNNCVLNKVKCSRTLYDFELNMNGGHVEGKKIENGQEVVNAFYSLVEGKSDKLLFAVGDGNHSLATAKTCWDNVKKTLAPEQQKDHPARFALCEAVNIYDGALNFEPIHRIVKTDKRKLFIDGLYLGGDGKATVICDGKKESIAFPSNTPDGIRSLDEYISAFLKANGGEVDYIHGDKEIEELSFDGVGIMLPPIGKDDFFNLIITGGNLPRKTFSMGEGNEKRYYIEAKKITY